MLDYYLIHRIFEVTPIAYNERNAKTLTTKKVSYTLGVYKKKRPRTLRVRGR